MLNADKFVPMGFQRLAVDTVQSLTVPPGATHATFRAEAQAIRYRDDGTPPSSTVGMPILVADPPVDYGGNLSQLQFIGEAAGGILNVEYYRNAG